MRSNPDLLEDVLCLDSALEEGLLRRTLHYARRRKRRSTILKAAMGAIVGCAGLVALLPREQERRVAHPPAPAPAIGMSEARVLPGTSIRVLTDDELLALFADRPVALVGSGGERQFVLLDAFRQPREQTVN